MKNIPLRSEQHAWEEVKRRCMAGQRRGASVEELRALLIECDAIADTILAQLYEGIHKNPKKWTPADDGLTDAEFVDYVNRIGITATAMGLRKSPKTIKAAYQRLRKTVEA